MNTKPKNLQDNKKDISKSSATRTALRIASWMLLTPIATILLLAIALYLPPVQNWAVQQTAAYASEKTGMDISVGNVRLACPLDLKIENVRVAKDNTMSPCEVANIRSIYIDVQFGPLLRGNVNIDALEISNMKVNTEDFIKTAVVKGTLKTLLLESHGIDINKELAQLEKVKIDQANLDIKLNDSVPEDTTKAEIDWKINLLKAELKNSSVRLHGKGLDIGTDIGGLKTEHAWIDLQKQEYKVGRIKLNDSNLLYANTTSAEETPPMKLTGLYAEIDSIYLADPNIHMNIIRMGTPYSTLRAAIDMDITAFTNENSPGTLRIATEGRIGKQDLAIAKDFIPKGVLEKLPENQLYFCADINGNAKLMNINNLLVRQTGAASFTAAGKIRNILNIDSLSTDLHCAFSIPDLGIAAMFIDAKTVAQAGFRIPFGLPFKAEFNINGGIHNLGIDDMSLNIPGKMNAKMNGHVFNLSNIDNLRTDICLSIKAPNIDFLTACIQSATLQKNGIALPSGMGISGNICIQGSHYDLDMLLTEGEGRMKIRGNVNFADESYDIDAQIKNMQINHFMPGMGIGKISTSIKAKGCNFDIMSKQARMTAEGSVNQLILGKHNLGGTAIKADIRNGKARALIDCSNTLLRGYADINLLLSDKIMRGTLAADFAEIDFQRLELTEKPLKFGLCTHLDIDYDFKEFIDFKGLVSDLTLKGEKKTFHPDDIVIDFLSRRDTTIAKLHCGDLYASLKSQGSYKALLNKTDGLSAITDSIISQKRLDLKELWAALPVSAIVFNAGTENPLSRFITFNGLKYKKIEMGIKTAPTTGINGSLELYGMNKDSLLIDTIKLNMKSKEDDCVFYGLIRNNKQNPQYTFSAKFAGRLQERGSTLAMLLYDENERLGLRIGLEGTLLDNGTKIRFSRENPILGYKQFTVNKDNYFILSGNRITADMRLKASDGTGIGIYTDDENTEALQDITVTLQNFNIKEILSSIPYAPNVAGILNGDYHVIIANDEQQTLSVSSSTSVQNLTYEDLKVGDVSADFVYMPDTAGTHHIDGILFMNDEEICSVVGAYNAENNGYIDAKVTMREMPLHIANGFIPNQIMGFKGKGDGELTIVGPMNQPIVNGEVFLDSCHMYSVPYGVDMRFSNDPVRIVNSQLRLENFEMYSHNQNPLTLAGNVDFSNLDRVTMNIRMKTNNFLLIDARENMRSEAFGKAYVDFMGAINGPISNLNMQGKLDILPSTDMSYILRDSPLTTDNQMDELVKFVNLKDSVNERVARPALTGFNMTMDLNINKGARVMCYLNTDHSNYVDLVGGGKLTMKYSQTNDLTMTGRYSLDGGQMKYSLPIIPLKTFEIKDGSYVEFTGDITNPRLNITATEELKAQVNNSNSGGERSVQFECGVKITKTLQNMGLEFTLDAPEDFEISSDLKAMSADMRGKLAVTMLTTGMYLADGNTNNFTMNTALSQFLQGEINNITGNALRTLDLSLGMDNTTDKTGNTHMDYSFRFSKRFFNNRLKVTVGGIVSTGNSMDRGQNNSVFDNMSLEYRLDNSGSTYLNAFYNNNAYDWLDGNTEEFGGGLMWRHSLLCLRDLFTLRKDSFQRDSLDQNLK